MIDGTSVHGVEGCYRNILRLVNITGSGRQKHTNLNIELSVQGLAVALLSWSHAIFNVYLFINLNNGLFIHSFFISKTDIPQ